MQRSGRLAWSVLVREVVVDGAADAEFSDFMHGRWSGLVRLGFGLTGDLQLAEDLARTGDSMTSRPGFGLRRQRLRK
jgi:hypothetical protein